LIALQAAGHIPDWPDAIQDDYLFIGELGLHGEIRPVHGLLPIAMVAKAGQSLVVPQTNQKGSLPGSGTAGQGLLQHPDRRHAGAG
jgi:magnesium chelatase family protein